MSYEQLFWVSFAVDLILLLITVAAVSLANATRHDAVRISERADAAELQVNHLTQLWRQAIVISEETAKRADAAERRAMSAEMNALPATDVIPMDQATQRPITASDIRRK